MTTEHPDAFTAVTNLIALIADPKAAGKRLSDLQQQIERAESATAKLEAARQAHDTKIAADRAALEARTAEWSWCVFSRVGPAGDFE
jgi:hypothetical protein